MELARKRLPRRLPFLLFVRSWRSFCDETVIFAKRLLTILQTSIAAPLLFQNVPRANDPTIYAGYTLADSLSLPLQLIPYSPSLFCPLLSFRFAFASQVLFFRHISLVRAYSNSNSERCTRTNDAPSGCPVWTYSCFLSLLIFPTVALKRLLFLLGSLCSTNSSWEHHIRADLLNNYDRKVRPVREGRREVTVQFSLRVGRLVKVVRQIIFGTPF